MMLSKTCCVRLVSKLFVECSGQNQCCVGGRETSSWIMFSIIHQSRLYLVHNNVFCDFGQHAE